MNLFLPVLKKEILELLRSKKILIIGVIFLFIAVSSPISAKLIPVLFKNISTGGIEFKIPDPTWKDAIDQFVKNVSQIILIVIVFMFAGAVAEEKSKKTLELVLTKPISRSNFVLAKFLSVFLVITLATVLSSIIFYFYSISLFGEFSLVNFSWLSLFILTYLLLIIAITLFCSVIAGSQIMAAVYSFIIQLSIFSFLDYIKKISNYLPGYVIGHYKDLMASGKYEDFIPSFITSLALILILIYSSILIFKQQEIER